MPPSSPQWPRGWWRWPRVARSRCGGKQRRRGWGQANVLRERALSPCFPRAAPPTRPPWLSSPRQGGTPGSGVRDPRLELGPGASPWRRGTAALRRDCPRLRRAGGRSRRALRSLVAPDATAAARLAESAALIGTNLVEVNLVAGDDEPGCAQAATAVDRARRGEASGLTLCARGSAPATGRLSGARFGGPAAKRSAAAPAPAPRREAHPRNPSSDVLGTRRRPRRGRRGHRARRARPGADVGRFDPRSWRFAQLVRKAGEGLFVAVLLIVCHSVSNLWTGDAPFSFRAPPAALQAARDPARDRARRQIQRRSDRRVALVEDEEAGQDLPQPSESAARPPRTPAPRRGVRAARRALRPRATHRRASGTLAR